MKIQSLLKNGVQPEILLSFPLIYLNKSFFLIILPFILLRFSFFCIEIHFQRLSCKPYLSFHILYTHSFGNFVVDILICLFSTIEL